MVGALGLGITAGECYRRQIVYVSDEFTVSIAARSWIQLDATGEKKEEQEDNPKQDNLLEVLQSIPVWRAESVEGAVTVTPRLVVGSFGGLFWSKCTEQIAQSTKNAKHSVKNPYPTAARNR